MVSEEPINAHGEKVYPILEVEEVTTLFIHKWQSLEKLFGNTLDLWMGGNYYLNYSFSLKKHWVTD